MLVDDQYPFRECAADELRGAGVRVVEASGVYDALRLARGREIDLLVIAGQQRHQSGWLCASKLCGQPPWKKVVLYFASPSNRDRRWSQASELAGLVETRGGVKPLVTLVLLHLDQLSPAALGKTAGV